MSTNRHRRTARLRARAAAIERRLGRAVVANFDGPVLGRANIGYELSERTKGTAHGGMGLMAELVSAVGLAEEIDSSLSLLKLHLRTGSIASCLQTRLRVWNSIFIVAPSAPSASNGRRTATVG